MKINLSSWIVNIIGSLASAGVLMLALNSPALPKGGTAYLVVFVIVMFLVALANAFKASVLPTVNAQAVLDHARDATDPIDPKVVKAAKDVVIKTVGGLICVYLLAACALFTKVVSVLTPADAALVTCLNDYVDATPANPLTIIEASAACSATVVATVNVIQADLAPSSSDAGQVAAHFVVSTARKTRLATILADAKAKGLVP